MNSTPLQPEGSTHLRFHCVGAPQGRVILYIGAMPFAKIWPLCTVSPRQPREDDPLYSNTPTPKIQSTQRESDRARLKEIADFVENILEAPASERKEAVFPGSVILGLLTDIEEYPSYPLEPTPTAAFIVAGNQSPEVSLWLPKIASALFIIDGQHRLKGLAELHRRLEERIKEINDLGQSAPSTFASEKTLREACLTALDKLSVPISLLVDFDVEEQAMVFATVNFKQKAVSRSFYFDIFGAFESDRVTPYSFTHDLILHLNNSEKSPLRGMIKLLGTGPGLISQAFLGGRLAFLVDQKYPKAVFQDFLRRRQKDDREASWQLAAIIRNFFAAVRVELNYAWPTQVDGEYSAYRYDHILCKSMGMAGLVSFLADVYRLALLDFAFGIEPQVASVFDETFFRRFLIDFDANKRKKGLASEFARTQPWSVGGSGVVEKRIYLAMRNWLLSAYLSQVTPTTSPYLETVEQFHGPARAVKLAQQFKDNQVDAFWQATEKTWLDLSSQA